MTEPDQIMQRFGEALAASQSGDLDLARSSLAELWAEVGDDGDPLHRCAIAHAMADLQDDLENELAWDLQALAAAEGLTDERIQATGAPGSSRSFQPSLHLNLADVYRRLGRFAQARHHLAAGLATVDALEEDGYGTMIREGLARVESQFHEGDTTTQNGKTLARCRPTRRRQRALHCTRGLVCS